MVAWNVTLPTLVASLVFAGVLVAAATATIVLLRRGRRWRREHGSGGRSLERTEPDSVVGVLAAAGSLPPDDAPGYADARESGPAVLRIDEADSPARCPACDRSLASEDAFCWRCGTMVEEAGGE